MTDQTIVAVYDTPAHAELAVQDLLAAKFSESAIQRHAKEGSYTGISSAATTRPAEGGFWSTLFGGEPDHDTSVYDRSVQNGSNAVSVRVAEERAVEVQDILERHNPIDLEDRASSYGITRKQTIETPVQTAAPRNGSVQTNQTKDGVIELSEESMSVGKRVVDRGSTRIRRFVVETPVEQEVNLRDEKVTIERHAVTDGRPVSGSFSDKTIEMTESAEEAVVSKTARVKEEINLRKEASDRTETVRDNVRREDVEITRAPGQVKSEVSESIPRKPLV